ncbi:MAG: SAM-dependent methyltransferase [Prevotella sp.]|nr:SAM-dependent methyltransferase [Staphylococcus sp.]MCM1350065.1 SAM-dependent methyltransferase [Prevotella sp.]
MPNERVTENLTLNLLGVTLSMNNVFAQGDTSNSDIKDLLTNAGGKPEEEPLNIRVNKTTGRGKPEFIILFRDDPNTILVVECKKNVRDHSSLHYNHPKKYAVDGVLYYAKYLKEKYNVIALAVSGTNENNLKVSAYEWRKKQNSFAEYSRSKDVVLEYTNYLRLFKGEQIQRKFSLDEIRKLALDMHRNLRQVKVTERNKPIFIAGVLIALNNPSFENDYMNLTSFDSIMDNLIHSIDSVLSNTNIKRDKIDNILQAFKILKTNTKIKEKQLGDDGSIRWYIEKLDNCIKPMMLHAENTLDALGVFYHEFIKYSGGDGSGLGIILTPQHLTEFMCDLTEVNKCSKVVDICCGSGSFLITAMTRMFKEANQQEIEDIRKNSLFGIDFDPELYTLAIANMIIRKDGKSNIYYGDCFDSNIINKIKKKNCNIGLINPPYSQKDKVELEFVEQLLKNLVVGGKAAVVVPLSCAIGTKYKEIRERLFKKHTLLAVFSMPEEIFYPTGTNVCVMLWEAHKPHSDIQKTFFGFCKEDGFVKKKKIGRVESKEGIWSEIENEWLQNYRDKIVEKGKSAYLHVNHDDEWLCEAYMETDYSKLQNSDFAQTIRSFLAHKVETGGYRNE